ncbi:glycosyltransferase family 2 protein [Clostridium sp. SHJSY1]|uniref:glycosyltransferase family 2 protein n=1 Tax=Clostridium sp. SHJSY1 TaxID=2942483 RepID=UPI0028763A2E|nr:glycosyltransferase family 2 protein [Clostridium sp. SHJSY1]MDS0526653.1 glycosyltransferase family 2 protein [Clostridium sp. SHJSY1]
MIKEPLVYIIIVNYNGYQDTIECVNSLKKITYNNIEIIVVDNASTNNSYNLLDTELDNCTILKSNSNNGFSAGNNIGIKYALEKKAEYILLLNNDTIVDKNFLNPLIEAMSDSLVGISAGKIYYYDRKKVIWSAGGYLNRLKALGCHYGMNSPDLQKFNIKREVSFLTGCCQLIRSSIFDEIGLYDEDYFLYLEDADYCLKVLKSGYKMIYEPKSVIYHKVSSSVEEFSEMYLYYFTRNRLMFMNKIEYRVGIKFISLTYFIFTRLISILKYRQKSKAILRGIEDYYDNKIGKSF